MVFGWPILSVGDLEGIMSSKLSGHWPGRKFQLWFYTPSHSLLLLRSAKNQVNPTRVDIVFSGVEAFECRTLDLVDLQITEVPIQELADRATNVLDKKSPSLKGYILTCNGSAGYVAAMSFTTKEDTRDQSAPSSINMNLDISVTSALFRL